MYYKKIYLLFNFSGKFPAFMYKCKFSIRRLLREAIWQTWKPRLITEKPIKRIIIWMGSFYKVYSEVAFSITVWRQIKAGNYYLLILQCVPALFLNPAKQNQKNKLTRIISNILQISHEDSNLDYTIKYKQNYLPLFAYTSLHLSVKSF